MNMKNKTLITCILTAFVVLSSQFQNLSAQNNIVDMSTTIHSRGSIVREYRKDVFLVYNDDRTFNLIEILTGSCLTINLPSITVNDFEIADDTAYFCGNIGSTVVAGWFSVYNAFYAGSPITMVFVPTSLSCAYWPSCTEEILSLDKLVIHFPADDGEPSDSRDRLRCTEESHHHRGNPCRRADR